MCYNRRGVEGGEVMTQEECLIGYRKTSVTDYPGKISSVLFFPECNWRCSYCHNSQLIEGKNKKTLSPYAEVLKDLQSRKNTYALKYVVLSGGEALVHPNLLAKSIQLKEEGFILKLDTNGSQPKKLRDLLEAEVLTWVALDLKMLPEEYTVIGVTDDTERVRESLKLLREAKDKGQIEGYTLRCTVYTLHTLEYIASMYTAWGLSAGEELQLNRGVEVPTAPKGYTETQVEGLKSKVSKKIKEGKYVKRGARNEAKACTTKS